MNIDINLFRRAMRRASTAGFDPYNSHDAQSKVWRKVFAEKSRYEAEREARAMMKVWKEAI